MKKFDLTDPSRPFCNCICIIFHMQNKNWRQQFAFCIALSYIVMVILSSDLLKLSNSFERLDQYYEMNDANQWKWSVNVKVHVQVPAHDDGRGRLISEWIYEVIVSSLIRTKKCQDFCPHYSGQKSRQFFFLILGETMTL